MVYLVPSEFLGQPQNYIGDWSDKVEPLIPLLLIQWHKNLPFFGCFQRYTINYGQLLPFWYNFKIGEPRAHFKGCFRANIVLMVYFVKCMGVPPPIENLFSQ